MLGFVPVWLRPFLAVFGFIIPLMIATVLPQAVGAILLVGVLCAMAPAVVRYRHWTGQDAPDGSDGMPVGRTDSVYRRR